MTDPLHHNAERVASFRRGDPQTLTAVYRETVKDVGNLVLRGFTSTRGEGYRVLGVRPEDAQRDVVQETYLKAFAEKARHSYDVNQPFRPYLLRITKNLMIDRLRKQGRDKQLTSDQAGVDIDEVIEQHQQVAAYAEGDVDAARLSQATRSFVQSCDDQLRDFVKLRFEEGLSQAQVAQTLSVTRRFVRTAEERARRGLRQHLKEQGLLDLIPGGVENAAQAETRSVGHG